MTDQNREIGKLYGIGVGPGDPELLTVKAVRTIQKLDVLYSPQASADHASTALKIAQDYLPEGLRIERRVFPMTHDQAEKEAKWEAIAQEVEEEVRAGRQVGFLTLGDPSTYSTYTYLLKYLAADIPVETIAGVSSYGQIAAQENLPLAIDKESFCVMPATAEADKIRATLELHDMVVLMKVKRHLKKVIPILEQLDLLDRAFIVSEASMAGKESFHRLDQLDSGQKLSYFSTMLVMKPDHSQASGRG